MNTLQFRPATINDFDVIYGLYMHPSTNPFLAFDIVPKEDFKSTFERLLNEGDMIVIGKQEETIGVYHTFNKEYRQADTVYLATLVIDPAMSGKGYGAITLQHIIQSMTAKNKNRIELEVSVTNENAIRFYEKAGFEIEGRIKQSYKISSAPGYHDDYRMAILLPHTQ